MSKRNNKFKLPPRQFKMPKLDVSIERGNTSKRIHSSNNNNCNSAEKFKNDIKKPAVSVLLDDDDDEDLLFASQMVESTQAEAIDLAFGNNNISSSTQIEPPKFGFTPNLFDEDSCDFELDTDLLNVINKNECKKESTIDELKQLEQNNMITAAESCIDDVIPISDRLAPSKQVISKDYDNNNDAIQVNQLVQRLDILNDESKKQLQQINQLNEKLSTKEGEISILRFEQRQLKQQIDTLRINKITEADVIKQDWQDRINELERNLKGKTVELNLKNNEILKLKQVLLDDSSTVDFRHNYNKSFVILYKLNCRQKKENLNNINELSINILKRKSHQNNTFLDKYYEQELDEICNVLVEIQLNHMQINNSYRKDILYNQILDSTTRALNALSKYIVSLKQFKLIQNVTEKSKFDIIQKNACDQNCSLHKISTKINIFQPNELFPNEKMIPLRRYIATLGLICEKLTNIKLTILTDITNSNDLLEKFMNLIKYSSNHFGILESIAYLLSSLAKVNKIKPYLNLLKNLIFFKPNIRILAEISRCLLIISNNEDVETFSLLCQKSEGYLCLLNDTKKKIRIQRNTSCILQIYGLILESEYKQNKSQNEIEWELLLITSSNHMEFLRNCFIKHPCFSITNLNTKCFCYMQICTSFVILFHIFIKHCIENPKIMYVENVRRICKMGSLLIFDIFYTNYRKCILQKGAVKQRLYITCEWLNENFDNLGLGKEYQIAIQRIRSSSIFADSNFINEDCEKRKGNTILRNIFDKNSFI